MVSFMVQTLQLHSIFLVSYWSHRSALFKVGEGYTGGHISGEKDNQGSSWKLATTGDNLENIFQNENFT